MFRTAVSVLCILLRGKSDRVGELNQARGLLGVRVMRRIDCLVEWRQGAGDPEGGGEKV